MSMSVLQKVLKRLGYTTFPHGLGHHVAIVFGDSRTSDFFADLVAKCNSLDEARAATNDCRDWQTVGNGDETVDYFPSTKWVQP
jgi:hypothetical protein